MSLSLPLFLKFIYLHFQFDKRNVDALCTIIRPSLLPLTRCLPIDPSLALFMDQLPYPQRRLQDRSFLSSPLPFPNYKYTRVHSLVRTVYIWMDLWMCCACTKQITHLDWGVICCVPPPYPLLWLGKKKEKKRHGKKKNVLLQRLIDQYGHVDNFRSVLSPILSECWSCVRVHALLLFAWSIRSVVVTYITVSGRSWHLPSAWRRTKSTSCWYLRVVNVDRFDSMGDGILRLF